MSYFEFPARILAAPAASGFDALIGEARREQASLLAARFPVPAHAVGYECRLARGDDRVDYNLAFFSTPALVNLLSALPDRVGDRPDWLRCIELLSLWSKGEHALARLVPFFCAAFDHDATGDWLPVPCLSLCIDPAFYARRAGFREAPVRSESVFAVARLCNATLTDQALDASTQARLSLILADPLVQPRHLSLMVSRREPKLKLDVRLPRPHLAPFLARLGFANAGEVDSSVDGLMRWRGHVQLNLVLSGDVDGPVELELLTDRREATLEDGAKLMSCLVERGLAAAPKAAALTEVWQTPLIDSGDAARVARSWYVKVRYHRSGEQDAKAYLGLMPGAGISHAARRSSRRASS